MPILRFNEFPEGSGSLSNDDIFLFMDDPSGSGTTKKISLSEISSVIGGGGGGSGTSFQISTIDLHNGGIQNAQVLQFTDADYQSVITGPTPASGINSQRIIIQGQRASGNAEGGDVYLWGGDADNNGGDIKIYAGDADNNESPGYGGYINIDAGNGFDNGGNLSLSAGNSTNAGGHVYITAGYSQSGQGGSVEIAGGSSSNSMPGPVIVRTNNNTNSWNFNIDSTLTLPNGGTLGLVGDGFPALYNNINAPVVVAHKDINTDQTLSQIALQSSVSSTGCGLAQIIVTTTGVDGYWYWNFNDQGNLNLPEGKVVNWGQNIDTLGPPVAGGGTDRVRLWDFEGEGSNFNYAIGAEGNHVWFAMDVNNGTGGFKFYSRDNEVFKISDDSKLMFPNGTTVAPGTFDNGTAGNSGISLNCYIGYELNWQGGHLMSTQDGGISAANIQCDSPIEFPGSGTDNVQIDNNGLTFSDGTTQNTAGIVSNTIGISGALSISNIVQISQADYDNLLSKDSSTLYIIND